MSLFLVQTLHQKKLMPVLSRQSLFQRVSFPGLTRCIRSDLTRVSKAAQSYFRCGGITRRALNRPAFRCRGLRRSGREECTTLLWAILMRHIRMHGSWKACAELWYGLRRRIEGMFYERTH